ncbi:MAG: hypothetical protein KGJ23_16250 [Euryarchaeota archaeon]|nr:hypothetical protein [Euryarchaeota archaeon]MDE1838151.1 hypothetical protein [Euryarchaeota archaeon]MDE2046630.1 hypothetical protein [Thermoplasmata archaeon]
MVEMKRDFGTAIGSNCILCLLHSHAGNEDAFVLPETMRFEPELTRTLMADHHDFTTRMRSMATISTQILASDERDLRVDLGLRLNREVNEFFARYLAHMNREEEKLIPAMKAHLSDDDIMRMGSAIEERTPPAEMLAYARWMLPSLNPTELVEFVEGAHASFPPVLFRELMRTGTSTVEPARWAAATKGLR